MAITKVKTKGITDANVTAAKLATDSVETAKITDANVTNAKLGTDISAAKLTAGTVATARLGSGTASSSTYLAGDQTYKTISEYNDDALQNDIATLALHQATNANAAKYNLANTNVDVFQDSTGVASFTDCARDATGEFVASVYEGTQAQVAQGAGTIIGDYSANGAVAFDGSGSVGWASSCYKTTMGSGMYIGKDWGSGVTKTISGFKHTSSSDDATLSSTSDCELRLLGHTSDAPASATQLGSLAINGRTASTTFTKLTGMTTTTAYRYHWIYIYRTVGTGGNAITSEIEFWETPTTESATGNFVSTATTANASVSKVGIVITYKNNAGTNTLNTDIVAQVSADGGSNYSTVTLAAAGTFSTGVLQAVANDVSVTAGTSIQYKISFANQALGSKEARITGVSLIY